jgi:hypothetical protein
MKASRNITIMVITVSLLYSIGSALYTSQYILNQAVLKKTPALIIYTSIAIGVNRLTRALTIFVYLKFNKIFRNTFYNYKRKLLDLMKLNLKTSNRVYPRGKITSSSQNEN